MRQSDWYHIVGARAAKCYHCHLLIVWNHISFHVPEFQPGVPLQPFCVWVPVVVIWYVLRFWFIWTLRFVRGAGSAVVWVCEGILVVSWAENIIPVIAIDVWYWLDLFLL